MIRKRFSVMVHYVPVILFFFSASSFQFSLRKHQALGHISNERVRHVNMEPWSTTVEPVLPTLTQDIIADELSVDVQMRYSPDLDLMIRKTPTRASKAANLVIEGDTLTDEPYMVALVVVTFCTALELLYTSAVDVTTSPAPMFSAAVCVASALAGILFSDLFSGLFHWSVDNYGSLETPIFGPVIAAFQGHHESPWTITYRNLPNNIHKICYGVLPLLALLWVQHPSAATTTFDVFSLMGLLLCQEMHKYSHLIKPPPLVSKLQNMGLILSKRDHGLHHSNPFGNRYCIVTGQCNEIMDNSGVYRFLEKSIFNLTGVEPNCWKLDKTGKLKSKALNNL